MKLKSFRVMNYRCIDDSGEVPVEQLKTLVGKNESGKTTILKALHKFNAVPAETYNGLKEFPRKRFHEIDENAAVVELKFSLDPEEKKELSQIDPRLSDISGVSVTKDYAGKYAVQLLPDIMVPPSNLKGLFPLLIQLRGAIDKLDDSFSGPEPGIRWKLLDALSRVGTGINEEADLSAASPTREAFVRQVQDILGLMEKQDGEAYKAIRASVRAILNQIDWPNIDARINEYVIAKLPVFIYFENYAILSGRIHLPSFVQRLKSGDLSPEDETARKLLSFVKLDPDKLVALGKDEGKSLEQMQEAIDTRALMVGRAALSLSGLVADLWQQRRGRLDLAIDGDYLRLWVADDIDGSRIELEQRSKGFQWFLSFYVVFMTESVEGTKDAVILLDEPGLHLHGSAQEDLLRVLGKLSEKNQIIYATHSPSMIDLDAVDTVSVLVETREGTKVCEPSKTTDKTALFPLLAALGHSMSRELYTGQYSLLVENLTDLWILSAISNHFKDSGRVHIDDDIVITPSGGGQKSAVFATMLAGDNTGVAVLVDSDVEGINIRKKLMENRVVRETTVLFPSDVTQEPGRVMELEDLLPVNLYLKFANEAYARELGKNQVTDKALAKGVLVRRYAEEEFKQRGLTFSRSKVARHMMNEFQKIPMSQLPQDFVEHMEHLFTNINSIKPTAHALQVPVETHHRSGLRAIFSRTR